jgi:hypothetical protein
MAITNPHRAYPSSDPILHCESTLFDEVIAAHGSPAELRLARPCPCWLASTGQPDPACTACFPFGYLWTAPVTLTVWGPNRKPMRRYEAQGTYELGDAFFTFPTGIRPTHYSRLVLPLSTLAVTDILTKGHEDTIRYAHVLSVEGAEWSRRTPATGAPYQRETVPLTIEGRDVGTPDLRITGRTVTWLNSAIPDGTRYVVRCTTYAEYVVWEVQDRNEGGTVQPYRALCKRLDFLLHPKGEPSATGALAY